MGYESEKMAEKRIGVFLCQCGSNIAGVVNMEKVMDAVRNIANVVHIEDYKYLCSKPGQQLIIDSVKEHRLDRVVIGSCSPRMHELTFRETMRLAGLNAFELEIANLREHVSWIHSDEPEAATEKAIDLVRMAIARARLLEPLEEPEVDIKKSTLIVGAGIAGISAALDLADGGFKVYLVEQQATIGGHMARWDKTFPTLDCSSCILTPRMAEVGAHPNIELLTMANVDEVKGFVGNFEVTIRQRPRYVDIDKCTACNECSEICPVDVPSEFDANLTYRKAIYIPFAQAVPSAYLLDMENCLGVDAVRCGKCKTVCGPEAIFYDDHERTFTVEVGTIIVSTGFEIFDALRDVEGTGLSRELLTEGFGMHAKHKLKKTSNPKPRDGLRLRRTLRGSTISAEIVQINLKLTKEGDKPLPALLGIEETEGKKKEGGEKSAEDIQKEMQEMMAKAKEEKAA